MTASTGVAGTPRPAEGRAGGGIAGRAAEPSARRLRRPSWRDPRLLIGLVLVLGSVAVGGRLFAAADRTVPVYAARVTLPAGASLDAGQLVVVRLRLTGTSARYLDATRPVPSGMVLQRTVGRGELMPVAALAPAGSLAARPVTVPLEDGVPAGIAPGGRVDVWATATGTRTTGAAAGSGGDDGTPRQIAAAVEVYHVTTGDERGLSAGRAAAVQVLVPTDRLPAVLAALARGDAISLLPVPGSAQ